jgi:hypothetical protein
VSDGSRMSDEPQHYNWVSDLTIPNNGLNAVFSNARLGLTFSLFTIYFRSNGGGFHKRGEKYRSNVTNIARSRLAKEFAVFTSVA